MASLSSSTKAIALLVAITAVLAVAHGSRHSAHVGKHRQPKPQPQPQPQPQPSPSYNASDASSPYYSGWQSAKATWYGSPTGAGPDDNGGACGFKNVNQYPFMSMTSCGNQPLFRDGKGCGSCYQIRCTKSDNPACSGNPQTVIITDMNYYPVAQYHFDLSGTAFGSMADPGLNSQLRSAGIISMEFRRVPCNFPGLTINFHVEEGSNPMYLAVLIEYEDMDGDLVNVEIMQANSGYWQPMRESWGSVWRIDPNQPLHGPFSFRIHSDSGKTLVANNVVPADWRPSTDYRSYVQY